jgi:hypothetical protein
MNGKRLTVSISQSIGLYGNKLGHFRRYGVLQCPRPALFDFGLLATDDRPVREKVFKLLKQSTVAHDG